MTSPRKIDVGAGNVRKEGYITVDVRGGDITADVTKGLPFADNSLDEVCCCQFFDHLHRDDALKFIAEAYRVLKPGGVIDIEFGDLLETCKSIVRGELKQIQNIYGAQRYPFDLHRWGYTPEMLYNILVAQGFHSVEKVKNSQTWQWYMMKFRGIK